jgi:hypothetical protein
MFVQSNEQIILMTRKQAFDKLRAKANESVLENIGRDAVGYMGAIDKGDLQASIYGKIKFEEREIEITLGANDKEEKVASVRYGIGTNTTYGKRDFLQYGMGVFLKYLGSTGAGSYLTKIAGKPRKSKRVKSATIRLAKLYTNRKRK